MPLFQFKSADGRSQYNRFSGLHHTDGQVVEFDTFDRELRFYDSADPGKRVTLATVDRLSDLDVEETIPAWLKGEVAAGQLVPVGPGGPVAPAAAAKAPAPPAPKTTKAAAATPAAETPAK